MLENKISELYKSFGYNSLDLQFSVKDYDNENYVDVIFNIKENLIDFSSLKNNLQRLHFLVEGTLIQLYLNQILLYIFYRKSLNFFHPENHFDILLIHTSYLRNQLNIFLCYLFD